MLKSDPHPRPDDGSPLDTSRSALTPRGAWAKHARVYSFSLAAMVVLLDQLSKLYVNTAFIYGARMPVWPGFDLTLIYNRGAAFSFLASAPGWQRGFFTLVGIGAVLLLTGLLYYKAHAHPRFMLALALIMGGALGNVMDRLAYGHVVDFLLFYWRDWYYPAFNLADISITCGAILLLWQEWVRLR